MTTLLQDMRYAARGLRRSPGFTLVALAALALGISTTTVVYSVVYAVLIRPLPYPDPERLVFAWTENPRISEGLPTISYLDFMDWRAESSAFERLAAFSFRLSSVATNDAVDWAVVSADFFPMLRVRPVLGRLYSPDEDRKGASPLVIISSDLWRRRYGSDPNTVGRQLQVEGGTFEIVGVLPSDFRFALPWEAPKPDAWVLLGPTVATLMSRADRELYCVGRLRSDVTLERASAEVDVIARRLDKQHPATNAGWSARIVPLHELWTGNVRRPLLLLFGSVGFVLLIACANVASLQLARAAGRTREIAIRSALGAGRARVFRQLMAENILLGLLGGVAGVIVAVGGIRLVVAWSPAGLPRVGEARIDFVVLAFSACVAIAAGALAGLAPALTSFRIDLSEALKESGEQRLPGPARGRMRAVLVVVQLALALTLLVGAGLLTRTLIALRSVDAGFSSEHVATLHVRLAERQAATKAQRRLAYEDILDRLRAVPGVEAAACALPVPLGGSWHIAFRAGGGPAVNEASYIAVTPGYFALMGVPLRAGRDFDATDGHGAARVALVNEALARRFWPSGDVVGKFLVTSFPTVTRRHTSEIAIMREIVGVVGNVRHLGLDRDAGFQVYVPFVEEAWPGTDVVLRTVASPVSLAVAVREARSRFDPDTGVSELQTMEDRVSQWLSPQRSNAGLLGAVSCLALALATIGIYSVLAYSVAQRTREIGIRMALGAERHAVLAMIVGQGLRLIAIGEALGIGAALALNKALASLVFGITTTDLATYAVVAVILAIVATAACYVPARRAAHLDPLAALRSE